MRPDGDSSLNRAEPEPKRWALRRGRRASIAFGPNGSPDVPEKRGDIRCLLWADQHMPAVPQRILKLPGDDGYVTGNDHRSMAHPLRRPHLMESLRHTVTGKLARG